jgi:hypothetical protein
MSVIPSARDLRSGALDARPHCEGLNGAEWSAPRCAALAEWIKTRRPLAEAQVAAIVEPLLEGLEVLLDFGSARQRATELTAVVRSAMPRLSSTTLRADEMAAAVQAAERSR